MKITIELDSSNGDDLAAMQRMFAQPSAAPLIAQPALPEGWVDLHQREPAPPAAPQPILATAPAIAAHLAKLGVKPLPKAPKPAAKAVKDVEAIVERGKEMTKATEALGKAVGERKKLTKKQKAKLAAKARWANHKRAKPKPPASKAAVKPPAAPKAPPPPKAPPKPPAAKRGPPRPEPKPQDFSRAEEQPISSFLETPGHEVRQPGAEPIPDYPDGRELLEGNFAVPPPPPEEEQDHERAIEQIARELGGLPVVDAEPADAVPGL